MGFAFSLPVEINKLKPGERNDFEVQTAQQLTDTFDKIITMMTLVLGGIYTIVKSQRQSRVPYLHRIPVIGSLFKNNEVTDQRKELLVFVTPRIVRLPEMAAN